MTHNEAISAINHNMPTKGTYTILTEALELAIKALEKQIAKKPTLVIDKSQNPPLYRCPCGIMSYYLEYEYCDECGQKLDWGNEE